MRLRRLRKKLAEDIIGQHIEARGEDWEVFSSQRRENFQAQSEDALKELYIQEKVSSTLQNWLTQKFNSGELEISEPSYREAFKDIADKYRAISGTGEHPQ